MSRHFRTISNAIVFAGLVIFLSPVGLSKLAAADPVKVICLGDSITKGVRPGVSASQTFAFLLAEKAKAEKRPVEVVNVGIGGERTDQALMRLETDVIAKKPDIVTVMYGANDSYVDPGKTGPRLTEMQFRENLVKMIERLQEKKIRVILMTEPRWGVAAKSNGLGEHPNLRMEPFLQAIRDVAEMKAMPLVDHYRIWTEFEKSGKSIGEITTDQLHPNPAGHRLLAESIWPVLSKLMESQKIK
ncbi:MAG: SGNH/GDSL hydrolase family protein [bacterium]